MPTHIPLMNVFKVKINPNKGKEEISLSEEYICGARDFKRVPFRRNIEQQSSWRQLDAELKYSFFEGLYLYLKRNSFQVVIVLRYFYWLFTLFFSWFYLVLQEFYTKFSNYLLVQINGSQTGVRENNIWQAEITKHVNQATEMLEMNITIFIELKQWL